MSSNTLNILARIKAAGNLRDWMNRNIEVVDGNYPHAYAVTDGEAVFKALKRFQPDQRWSQSGQYPNTLYFESEEDLIRFKMTV